MIKKLIKNLTASKNANTKRFHHDMAHSLDRRTIKYCAERDPDTGAEIVIGRAGEIYLRGDEISVVSSDGVVFRGKVEDVKMSELLSLNGAIFSGPDLERGGEERTVVAYYTHY